jgi:hypothetical protein
MNRRQRQAEHRRVMRQLRQKGCRCTPTIRWADQGGDGPRVAGLEYAGLVWHEPGCPLGDGCLQLNETGLMPGLVTDPRPRHESAEDRILRRLRPAADQAIAERRPIGAGNFVVVPDCFVDRLPGSLQTSMAGTVWLERDDGRWVAVFEGPEG